MNDKRSRGRAATWLPERARRYGWAWPGLLGHGVEGLRSKAWTWLIADVGPGRLMPWLPVAFGFGIVLYFSAETEPSLTAVGPLALGCAALAFVVRHRPLAFPVLLGVTAIAAGLASATWRAHRVAHPVLHYPAFDVRLTGFVEVREIRARTDRIVVAITSIKGRRLNEAPDRVRLAVRKGQTPNVGAHISVKARLNPPLAPLRPGGYDFARDLYFQGIGASGFVLGAITILPASRPAGARLSFLTVMENLRTAIDTRIRAVVDGDEGRIASALITGKRDAISQPVNDAMYISSLAHVLSISGYHMAVVAGVVFFVIRAFLALVPVLATRYPIKKWAAFGALAAAAFYLFLSGAEVATQRSFIMTAIVLVGVMVDRPALTLRTLSIAALFVLLLAPEAIVHPSFQMSFAATLALVAAWERGLSFGRASRDTSLGARAALWGGREIMALVIASMVAGLATMPYAAYHFHRAAPYGVIANLLAMPIVSAIVMPAGLLAVAAMPFGFDGPLWRLMGHGITWMTDVALWVSALPGAVGRIAAFGTGPLLLATLAMLLLCLLRSPLRWSGAAVAVIAAVLAMRTPPADVLISAQADVVAVRTATGRLSILRTGAYSFAPQEWLAADADTRTATDPTLRDGVTCDEVGCTLRLPDGKLVAVAQAAEAFTLDCQRAALIVTRRTGPPGCPAKVIDRNVWRFTGALALRKVDDKFEMVAARPRGYDRPWSWAPPMPQAPAIQPKPVLRDATPKRDALDADD